MKFKRKIKKIHRKINARLLTDIGKPRDTIILAGMGRSGTTWGGEILNYDNSYRLMYEPFLATKVPEASEFEYIQYLNANASNPALEQQAKKIMAGKIRNKWVDKNNDGFYYRKRIIKEIRGNLMLGWMKEIADKPPVVLMVRHPLQVVSSWTKLRWGKEVGGTRSNIDIITSQPALIEDYPLIKQIMKDINLNDNFEKLLFEWCIFHYIPIQQLRNHEAYALFYEYLLIDPDGESERLFKFLNRPIDPHKLDKVLRKSNGNNFSGNDVYSDKSYLLNAWKTDFTQGQIARAHEMLEAFDLDKLYDPNGSPTGNQVFKD